MVDDVETRAVVVVEALPASDRVVVTPALLVIKLLVQPVVAKQQLLFECLLKPTVETKGHMLGRKARAGDATRLASGKNLDVEERGVQTNAGERGRH